MIGLKDVAERVAAEPRERVLVETGDLDAGDGDRARARAIEAGDEAEQGGLSAPGGAGDRADLARGDVERDAVENGERSTAARQAHDDVANADHLRTSYYTGRVRRLRAGALILLAVSLLSVPPGEARGEGVVVALGDSLTAGFGVAADEAFPARLESRLKAEGYPYRVVNAGVSGDTTAGGLRRDDWVLRASPEIVIVALGANDGLRGQDPKMTRANLEEIVTRLQAAGARVLLVGMRLPPNYGDEYTKEFEAVFPAVARRAKVTLAPFLLDGVAGIPRLNQADGIHPTTAGQQVIADHLWPYLRPLLRPTK